MSDLLELLDEDGPGPSLRIPATTRVTVELLRPVPDDVWDAGRWDRGRWDAGTAEALDATCDTEGVQITAGRDGPTAHARPATCTVALADPAGRWTPWADAAGARRAWWLGSPLKVSTDDGPLFVGYVTNMAEPEQWEAPEDRVVTVQALGSAGHLARANGLEQAAQGGGETARARLNRICDAARLPAWVVREFDVGAQPLQATTLARGALEECWLVADSDGGAFFDRPGGALRYVDVSTIENAARYTEPQAVFGDGTAGTVECATAFVAALDGDASTNVVSIARVGGTASVARADPGPWLADRTYQRHDLIHQSDAWSGELAARVLERLADRELVISPLVFDPLHGDAEWDAAHRLEPYDLVGVVRRRDDLPPLEVAATIDQIRHEITPDAWTTTVTLSPGVQRMVWARWDQTTARWDTAKWS